jgi:penicillin amidase
MKRLRKILKVLLIVLVVLAAGLAVAGTWLVRRAWPQTDGEASVAGLGAPVEVIRDRWGVPHIFAGNERDLFLAQGWVHAQDRFWQMEFNRRVASGQLASVLGPPLVETDRLLRTYGLRRAAERDLQLLDPETRALLQAYADGVNRWLESHRDGGLPVEMTLLSIEPAPWSPVDSLAWIRLMGLNLSLNQGFETARARLAARLGPEAVAQLLPGYPEDGPVIIPDQAPAPAGGATDGINAADASRQLSAVLPTGGVPPFWGSNNWVVHGSRTATGRPLFANDTHLGLALPSIWYANGLHGGRFDTAGFSFAGMPLVVLGHNRRIAWGITNLCADVQDLYRETLDDPAKPTRYRFQNAWRPLQTLRETVEVRGGQPVTIEIRSTQHGPLVQDIFPDLKGGPPTSLRWSAMDGGSMLGALRGINLAGDWEGFRTALRTWTAPSVNLGYADVDGHIGYHSTGLIPIRPQGDEGLVPVDGASGAHEWQGYIPYDEMPQVLDPGDGFVVTANNRVVGKNYPYFIARDMADPFRALRIRERLLELPKATAEDMRLLQADILSIPARDLRPFLLEIQPKTDLERKALEQIRSWDLRMSLDSAAPTIFEAWLDRIWDEVFADDLGKEMMEVYRPVAAGQVAMLVDLMGGPGGRWIDDRRTPQKETRADIAHRALAGALAQLQGRLGSEPADWKWERVHTVSFAHTPLGQSGIKPLEWIFNSPTWPLAGDVFTVNENVGDPAKPYQVNFGSSQRLIVDLSDVEKTLAVNSTGASGHPFHKHRDDESALWVNVALHPLPFSREGVEKVAEDKLVLKP